MADTLATLRARAQEKADMVSSGFVGTAVWTQWLNEGLQELWEAVSGADPDAFATEVAVTLAGGSGGHTYTLPADFMSLRGVDYLSGSVPYSVPRFAFEERNDYRRPLGIEHARVYRLRGATLEILPEDGSTGSYTVHYIPLPTPLAGESDTLAAPLYSILAETFIVTYAAIQALRKEESDTRHLDAELELMRGRVLRLWKKRDRARRDTIADDRGW